MTSKHNVMSEKNSVLKLCIEKGWRKPGEGLNDFNEDDETALEKALYFSDINQAELERLLIAGADPNICYISEDRPIDDSGFYPL